MQSRSLILLLLISGLSACNPPPPKCTETTCRGCCDASGACQVGNTDQACGFGAALCGVCSGAVSCQANACLPTASGGGAGGGSGGGGAMGGGGGAMGGGGGTQTGTFTVSGRVTYDFVRATFNVAGNTGTLDFAGATRRPVRNAVVRVVEGTAVLATGNTAADGAYSLMFTATGAGALQVQVLARTSSPPITILDNTSGNAVWAIGAPVPAGGGTLDLRATHGWAGTAFTPSLRTSGPFAILDSTYTASIAFLAARPALNFPR